MGSAGADGRPRVSASGMLFMAFAITQRGERALARARDESRAHSEREVFVVREDEELTEGADRSPSVAAGGAETSAGVEVSKTEALVAMGFARDDAEAVLMACGGDVEATVAILLG